MRGAPVSCAWTLDAGDAQRGRGIIELRLAFANSDSRTACASSSNETLSLFIVTHAGPSAPCCASRDGVEYIKKPGGQVGTKCRCVRNMVLILVSDVVTMSTRKLLKPHVSVNRFCSRPWVLRHVAEGAAAQDQSGLGVVLARKHLEQARLAGAVAAGDHRGSGRIRRDGGLGDVPKIGEAQ